MDLLTVSFLGYDCVNPFNSNISMQVLDTFLYTFPMVQSQ